MKVRESKWKQEDGKDKKMKRRRLTGRTRPKHTGKMASRAWPPLPNKRTKY